MALPQRIPLEIDDAGREAFGATENPNADFAQLIGTILSPVMVIALLILLFLLIWGAFEWMTSGGDNSKLQNARNRMLHAIVGILLLSATLAIFTFVQYLLGIEILSFGLGGTPTPGSGGAGGAPGAGG